VSLYCSLTPIACDTISLLSGRKFNEACCKYSSCEWIKGLHGHRSKVKVIAMPNAFFPQRDSYKLTAVRSLSVRRRHACDGLVYPQFHLHLINIFRVLMCRKLLAHWCRLTKTNVQPTVPSSMDLRINTNCVNTEVHALSNISHV